jgi:hypothetical protein
VLKAGRLLAERREEQGILVPVGDGGMEAGGDDDFAAVSSLQRGIAADVVGVRVGVDQRPRRRPPARGDQVDGLRGVVT